MVRKTVWVGILASAMMVWAVGAALAAPTTTSLSSWQSTVVDGHIIGGDRTVVVTNTTGEPLSGYTMDLGPAPCNCVIVDTSQDQTVTDNVWVIPDLAVGETASLTLRYHTPETRMSAVGPGSFLGPIAIFAATLMVVTVGMAVAGRRRLALAL